MPNRALIAAALALPLFAGTAFAQDVSGWTELDDATFVIEPWGITLDEVEDVDVYGADGEQVGDVEEILVDAAGTVQAAVIETEGFLGIGDEDVVVTLDHLEFTGDRFVTVLNEEQIEAFPEWED